MKTGDVTHFNMAFGARSKYGVRSRYASRGFKGRGLYTAYGAGAYKLGKNIGGSLGKRIGIGRRMGAAIGGRVENLANKFMGKGAYHQNALIRTSKADANRGVPSFSSKNDETGALTITHKEYISDVYGNEFIAGSTTTTVPFKNIELPLNPGMETTFPWLSQLAANYEEYEFQQLMFTFRSVIADVGYSSSGQIGTCIMATNYNAGADKFQEKQSMMEYDGASSCKASQGMLHGVECDPRKLSGSRGKYVRSGPNPINTDIKTYDHGKFQLAFANTPAALVNQTMGELWVSYTVKLRKPKFFTGKGSAITRSLFAFKAADLSHLLPFGNTTGLLTGQANSLYAAVRIISGSAPGITFVLPANFAGVVRLTMTYDGTGFSTTNCPINSPTLGGNVQPYNDIVGSSQAGTVPHWFTLAVGSAGTAIVYIVDVKVAMASNSTDNTITLSAPSAWANPGITTTGVCYDLVEMNSTFQRSDADATPAFYDRYGNAATFP